MAQTRIETLRHLVAAIGQRQIEYHRFFPAFADRLETELGEYLGDPACVALSSAQGEFSFDQGSYRHGGIGIDHGRYRIPLMFRLKNLKDDGDLLVRLKVFFTLDGDKLTAQIEGEPLLQFSKQDLTPLLEYIYHDLQSLFATGSWFEQKGADYAGSAIGFVQERSAT